MEWIYICISDNHRFAYKFSYKILYSKNCKVKNSYFPLILFIHFFFHSSNFIISLFDTCILCLLVCIYKRVHSNNIWEKILCISWSSFINFITFSIFLSGFFSLLFSIYSNLYNATQYPEHRHKVNFYENNMKKHKSLINFLTSFFLFLYFL